MTKTIDNNRFWELYNLGFREFNNLKIQGIVVTDLHLSNIKFDNCEIIDSDFSGSTFFKLSCSSTTFINCDLSEIDCSESEWSYAEVKKSNMKGAIFNRIKNAFYLYFNKVDLENALFYGANLGGSQFIKSNLKGVQFGGSKMKNVYFSDSVIGQSEISNKSTDFTSCDLESATFNNKDFTDTIFK